MASPTQQLLDGLPLALRRRFAGVPEIVRQLLTERDERGDSAKDIDKEELQATQYLTLVWMIDRFLQHGTIATLRTIDVLNKADIRGFTIGSSNFDRDSPETYRGKDLSEALRDALTEAGIDTVWLTRLGSCSLAEAVYKIRWRVLRGRPLD